MGNVKNFLENLRQEKEKYSKSAVDFHSGGVDTIKTIKNVLNQSKGLFDFEYGVGQEVYILNPVANIYEKRKIISILIGECDLVLVEFNKKIKINEVISTKFAMDDIEEYIFTNKPFVDFFAAYKFLEYYYIFKDESGQSRLNECISINVVKVNPETLEIDNNINLNTFVQVWIEAGRYDKECKNHDYRLDCGGDTYEKAIIELANLVNKVYN